ncbi:Uncharacterised protein [Serratia fonticola]|uniref:Uncharacterized protein n=1 Tax=Serratia fonticola TaxID=47917 RepID=A0A4U9W269_SERFO|nr:Uncharacterised protein [Serratia fonticola]
MGIVPYRRASTLIGKCLVTNGNAKITRGFRGITMATLLAKVAWAP